MDISLAIINQETNIIENMIVVPDDFDYQPNPGFSAVKVAPISEIGIGDRYYPEGKYFEDISIKTDARLPGTEIHRSRYEYLDGTYEYYAELHPKKEEVKA